MALRKTTLEELDRLRSDDEIAAERKDLRPWFARPLMLFGVGSAVMLLLFVLALFLRAAP